MAGEYITIDAVIAEAASVIKNFSEQEMQLARQWAYTAVNKIGLGKLNVKVSDPLYLTDWSATKPTDMAGRAIDIALYDSAGQEIITSYKGRAQHDTSGSVSRVHQDVRSYAGAINITEDDTYFNVEEFSDSSPSGVYLVVKYHAFPVDANGYPLIQSDQVLAVMMYIRWMWAMRSNAGLGAEQLARENWLRERASAYGKMKTPSVLEGKEFAKSWNSMIQKVVVLDRQF